MTVRARDESNKTVLVVLGTFDAAEAERLHDALVKIERERPVTIDFHEVRLFKDFAVAGLVQEIAARMGRVTLVGLSEHHHRLLRYVGA